ncbi:MAG: ArsR/SmtB family transcription factor [Burkholderiales bacterium]
MDELTGVFETVSRYFSILSEPVRVRIVHAICQQERTVNDIVAATHASQTTVSRHLALMYREGVVARRRDGGFVYYTASDDALAEICRTVCVHIASRDDVAMSPARGALRIAKAFEPAKAKAEASRKKPGANSASSDLKSRAKITDPSKEKSRL